VLGDCGRLGDDVWSVGLGSGWLDSWDGVTGIGHQSGSSGFRCMGIGLPTLGYGQGPGVCDRKLEASFFGLRR